MLEDSVYTGVCLSMAGVPRVPYSSPCRGPDWEGSQAKWPGYTPSPRRGGMPQAFTQEDFLLLNICSQL